MSQTEAMRRARPEGKREMFVGARKADLFNPDLQRKVGCVFMMIVDKRLCKNLN